MLICEIIEDLKSKNLIYKKNGSKASEWRLSWNIDMHILFTIDEKYDKEKIMNMAIIVERIRTLYICIRWNTYNT